MEKKREDTIISRGNWKHIFNKQNLWEEIKQDIDALKWDDFHTVFIFFFLVQICLMPPYDPDVFFFNCDTGKYKGEVGEA